MDADLGIFAQDQWTVKRLTLNLGVRYDYFRGSVPAQDIAANRWLPARHFEPVEDVPLWHDVYRVSAARYDLFGNGKTALKANLSRYVLGEAVTIANANNPVSTSVASASRNWTDRNGNWVPDCDFSNPAEQLECGPLSNLQFGQNNVRATRYDPAVLSGWGS